MRNVREYLAGMALVVLVLYQYPMSIDLFVEEKTLNTDDLRQALHVADPYLTPHAPSLNEKQRLNGLRVSISAYD